jgi:hypothetical protein
MHDPKRKQLRWVSPDTEKWRLQDPRGGWGRVLEDMNEDEIIRLEMELGARIRRPTDTERIELRVAEESVRMPGRDNE